MMTISRKEGILVRSIRVSPYVQKISRHSTVRSQSQSWVTYIFVAIHAQTLDYFHNLFIAPVELFELFLRFFVVPNVIGLPVRVVQFEILYQLADGAE